jgi:hypothetical protein
VALRSSENFLIQNINVEQEIENIFYQIHFAENSDSAGGNVYEKTENVN